ncbi:28S ribosomal protein S5, mitochondrial-like [Penaeus chinensis]|uniref:28S ribosomal protein S5, mitochondrial-like n=1 Tax=Penaeus chinensis TaxID=139456 RepID=UPI001FB6B588|nr:28S ribosomal protein S5, mitochondrial-like [Penaeus chinensis]
MAGSTRLGLLAKSFNLLSVSQPPLSHGIVRQYATAVPFTRPSIAAVPLTTKINNVKQRLNQPQLPQVQPVRSTSFFNKLPADQLWKGVTSVSNAGKKRGRGKGVGKKMAKNLNRGQMIGVGRENIVWPGLNAPILRGKELIQQQKLPKDTEREAKLIKMRDTMGVFRPLRLDPLERGWSGNKMPGRSIGPPNPIGEDNFEGFDTKVLELKTVTHMSGIFGRKRRMSMFVVTGNGNGLGGFALAKANTMPDTMRKAKNRAGQKLIYVERYNDHTVFHDFFSQFGYTKLFVKKKPEGYGLVCHRAIRTICEVIGIKDIYVKVEGSTNIQNLTKAFFLGLINQKTHQDLSEAKQLHLVEFRKENLEFPRVVASPQGGKVRNLEEIPKDEELDFGLYTMDGKVELQRKKYPPGYQSLPSYNTFLKKYLKRRNHDKVMVDMRVEYGELRSFYTEKHPECKPGPKRNAEEAM